MIVIYIVLAVTAGWLTLGLAALLLGTAKMNLPSREDAKAIVAAGPVALGVILYYFTTDGGWYEPWIHPRDWKWPC